MSAIPFRSYGDRFYHYIGVNFMFGLLDCDRYMGDIVIPWIVKPGFCSIYYTVGLAGLKNVNRYIGNIVLSKIVKLGFHCAVELSQIRHHSLSQTSCCFELEAKCCTAILPQIS